MTEPVRAQTTLLALTRDRLRDLGRALGVSAPASLPKDEQARRITQAPYFDFRAALREFTRDELREACRLNDLDDSGRARIDLASRLLDRQAPVAEFQSLGTVASDAYLDELGLPTPGELVVCRQRQYLVEDVERPEPSPELPNPMSRVRMVCLDDDAPGRVLEVLWELELGARVLRTRSQGLGDVRQIDPPRHFAAYLNALKWNCVTATDAQLFQSPFRAGIKLMNHQLTPLQKALKLPRANLFIADDVGLGKTIEAGLVLQELMLRQRVDFTLIVCPASVVLQWRDEMRTRFGRDGFRNEPDHLVSNCKNYRTGSSRTRARRQWPPRMRGLSRITVSSWPKRRVWRPATGFARGDCGEMSGASWPRGRPIRRGSSRRTDRCPSRRSA